MLKKFSWILCCFLLACSKPPEPSVTLFHAVENGDLDQVKRHIHWQTDLNAQAANGERALHVAARRGRWAMFRLLVQQGADPAASNAEGHDAMQVALFNRNTEIAQLLVKQGSEIDAQSLLFQVIDRGLSDRDVLDFLIQQGADLNQPNPAGDGVLHMAIHKGDRRMVKLLLGHAINLNQSGSEGLRPLALATRGGQPEIISMLKAQGALP